MQIKDILYLAMFFIIKNLKKYSSGELLDFYEIVIDCVSDKKCIKDTINNIRSRCLPCRCADCTFDFLRFYKKFDSIVN